MKQLLLSLFLGAIHSFAFTQYWGFTDAQRNELQAQIAKAKVKMKISTIQGISIYNDEVYSEEIRYEKFNRLGSMIEHGKIVNGEEMASIKRYYNEKNELIQQDHFGEKNRLKNIRYWEYDSLGHVVFEKDSALHYRAKYLYTKYSIREDASICGITTGFERTWYDGKMQERIVPGSFIIYENNDLLVTRGGLNEDGEMGESGTIQEFNENGVRVGFWSCSRLLINNKTDNNCSSNRWIYNDKGLITHTESKDVNGFKPRQVSEHQYTYNAKGQLINVRTEYYSLISFKKLFWNSRNQIYKIIYEDGSASSHQQLLMTYNSKGLIETETYKFVQGGQRTGFNSFSYEYYED